MQKILQEFKDFVMRGTLIELAVAFIIAAAFTALVTAFIGTMINPLLGAIFTEPNFNSVTIPLWSDARLQIGSFIMAVITFLSIAATVFFFIVRPYNLFKGRREVDEAPPPPPEDDESVVLLREIRDALKK
ncbi:MAG: large conductance mechanosensitive channel protein MscL [Actinobacteria bacterium]|nr:large conductance mechanosensitive channel protein MscL [Actinomycetota bacterium]MBU1493550.1 large conductance mechanosensitive channel protein MscL [Actinomycetota bacterium]MBU1865069.1 large conductance mechanosensitive channel protein MscL [Actinomycetota bacterium]